VHRGGRPSGFERLELLDQAPHLDDPGRECGAVRSPVDRPCRTLELLQAFPQAERGRQRIFQPLPRAGNPLAARGEASQPLAQVERAFPEPHHRAKPR